MSPITELILEKKHEELSDIEKIWICLEQEGWWYETQRSEFNWKFTFKAGSANYYVNIVMSNEVMESQSGSWRIPVLSQLISDIHLGQGPDVFYDNHEENINSVIAKLPRIVYYSYLNKIGTGWSRTGSKAEIIKQYTGIDIRTKHDALIEVIYDALTKQKTQKESTVERETKD
jgi:hypothetical protein